MRNAGVTDKRASGAELERRWRAVREAMQERGLDFLVMQGGYMTWFTDLGAAGVAIFPREDGMTTIFQGPRLPPGSGASSSSVGGIKKRITVPIFASLAYSNTFSAEVVVEELAPHGRCRVGLVGLGFMPAAFYNYVTSHLLQATFEVATDWVDEIKAIKSDEELALIREVCGIQDGLFAYTLDLVRPGKRVYDIYIDVIQGCLKAGCEQMNIMIGAAPAGEAARLMGRNVLPRQGRRVLAEGDQFNILIETDGPAGLWAELARSICIGRVSQELKEHFEVAKKAQQVSLDLLRPGVSPETLWEANNRFLRQAGYLEERRIYAHGQGYDMVERPCLSVGDTMKLKAGMNMAVHPSASSSQAFGWICENYIVQEAGPPERLHRTPREIFVV